MEQHILFFDIDGTIITEETGLLPESALKALKEAKEKGHILCINTGRTWAELEDRLFCLGFDGFVCGCGTYIKYKDKVLLQKELGHRLSAEIAADLEDWNIDAVLEGNKHIYFKRKYEFSFIDKIKDMLTSLNHGVTYYYDDKNINFDKLTAWANPHGDFPAFREKYSDLFEFIDRGKHFFEIIPKACSKASGIEFLLSHFQLSLSRAIAVGDSTNDLSMLKYVEKSIAMGNSDPVLFDIVDFVTRDILEDGLYYGLKHYGII